MKNILDSKEFRKTMRPFLFDKITVFSQISKEKNKRIMSGDFDLSKEFSNFFEDAVKSLNVKPDEFYLSYTEDLSDTIDIVMWKFENHPSVQAIK